MDKLYHLIAGCIISLIVGVLFYNLGIDSPIRAEGYGFIAAILAGAAKETFDAIRAKAWTVRTWDVFDWLATCVGGFAGVGILIVGFGID